MNNSIKYVLILVIEIITGLVKHFPELLLNRSLLRQLENKGHVPTIYYSIYYTIPFMQKDYVLIKRRSNHQMEKK